MRLVLGLLLATWAGALAAANPPGGTAAADSTAVPAYLSDLRALAEERLAADETGLAPALLARRVKGPMSRAEYEQYVGDATFAGTVEADSVTLTRPVIPRVVITDREAIGYLFACCAYDEPDPEAIEFIEIYDVSRSGFSNGDMMVVHPSGNSYILEGLDADFLDSAAGWETSDKLRFRAFHRETAWMGELVEDLKAPATADWDAPPPDLGSGANEDQALRGIWAGLHRAVASQYGDGNLEMRFARDDSTTTIEFWGYEAADLDFNWLGEGAGRGGVDLLTVTVSDTIATAYQTFVDVLVVKETTADTVFVPLE